MVKESSLESMSDTSSDTAGLMFLLEKISLISDTNLAQINFRLQIVNILSYIFISEIDFYINEGKLHSLGVLLTSSTQFHSVLCS